MVVFLIHSFHLKISIKLPNIQSSPNIIPTPIKHSNNETISFGKFAPRQNESSKRRLLRGGSDIRIVAARRRDTSDQTQTSRHPTPPVLKSLTLEKKSLVHKLKNRNRFNCDVNDLVIRPSTCSQGRKPYPYVCPQPPPHLYRHILTLCLINKGQRLIKIIVIVSSTYSKE